MKNNLKIIIFVLIIVMAFSSLSGCSPLISDSNPDDDTPLFPGDTSEVQAKDYMLYFQLDGEEYLAPEIRTLTIPESKSVEETLVKELVNGPEGNSTRIIANINENTRVISVTGNEDVLFVSLSYDFLTPPAGLGQDIEDEEIYNSLVLTTRRMALYAIANTVTELGRYSSVQFSIDYDNNGTGIRPTRGEMGFVGEGENQLIEPLYRNADLIFSPASCIQVIMNAISEKNWDKVLKYTSIAESPDESIEEITRQLEVSDLSLLEYQIISDTVSLNGTSAVVVLTYTFASEDGTSNIRENISFKMLLEDGIWKCSLSSIKQMLLGEYQ